jgi:DNA (cytosine-5)-methyltransferase 1
LHLPFRLYFRPLQYLDAFSGIGGFALPLEEFGHECIGFCEIDPYAIQIYRSHFPSHPFLGDITTITAKTLPAFDLLVGGFPCQAFSVAGDRRGFEDTRGTLFFELCRIAKAKRPRLLLVENVAGLLAHNRSKTFGTILAALDGLGYDLQWQVLRNVPNNNFPTWGSLW